MDIKYYRDLKLTERLQGTAKLRPYTLMEHHYMVTVLFKKFAAEEDVAYDMPVLDLVMHHDIVEVVTADLIWPVKNHSPKVKAHWEAIEAELVESHFQLQRYSDENLKSGMNTMQYRLFKVCDLLDLYIFVKEEQQMGNNSPSILEVIKNCHTIFEALDLAKSFPKINRFITENYG